MLCDLCPRGERAKGVTMDNVFQVAVNTLNQAGELAGINARVMEFLQEPKRIQLFRIPLKLEDGSFGVFPAYRVH